MQERKQRSSLLFGGQDLFYSMQRLLARIKSSYSSNRPRAEYSSLGGKELNQFCPPNSSDDLCLLFCLYPSSMAGSCTCRSPWRLGCRRTRGGGAGWCPPPPRPPPPEPTHDPRPSPARWRRNAKKTKDSSCVPELSVFFGESVRGCLNFLQIQLGNNLKLQICCLHFVKCIVLAPAGKGGSEQRL